MSLHKCKLGELITQRREKNNDDSLPISGVSKDGLIPPKQQEADTSLYNMFYRGDFIFNPARMELNSIAYNDKYDKAICSSLYEVFYVHRTDLILPEFLALIVKQDWFTRYCEFLGQGSAREYCRFANISEIEIEFPDIDVQKKTVHCYNVIKRRIELKQQINDNLDAQAEAIYKDIFVINPSPDWATGTLKDLLTVKYGKDHKQLADGNIPLYGSGGIMRYVERALYEKESVLVPRKGSLNNVLYVNKPFWSVDTMFYTEMKHDNVAKYVYYYIREKDLAGMDTGSAVPSMSAEIIHSMQLFIPDNNTLDRFERILKPIFLYVETNTCEIEYLKALSQNMLTILSSR
jgi:restriction endonuclease S subunit